MYDQERVPVPRSQVSVKTIATICFTVLGIYVGLYLVVHARVALSLIVLSAILAIALHHGVDLLRRRGVRRGLAILGVVLGMVALISGILLLLVPAAVDQVRAFAMQVPELLDKVRHLPLYHRLDARFSLDQKLDQLRAHAPAYLEGAIQPAISIVQGVVAAVAGVITVIALIVFMLLYGEGLAKRVLNEALPSRRALYARLLRNIYDAVGGYVSGLGLICLCNAAATTAFLAIVRTPFFLPLGILSGLSSLLPLVGNTVVGTLITLIALAAGGLWKGVACAIWFIVYQQVENHVLGPVVYRRTVQLNPLVIVIALLVFAELAGIPGAIVAVPAVAVGQILLREVLRYRREQFNLPSRGPASGPPPNGQPPGDSSQLELELPEPEGIADHRH